MRPKEREAALRETLQRLQRAVHSVDSRCWITIEGGENNTATVVVNVGREVSLFADNPARESVIELMNVAEVIAKAARALMLVC